MCEIVLEKYEVTSNARYFLLPLSPILQAATVLKMGQFSNRLYLQSKDGCYFYCKLADFLADPTSFASESDSTYHADIGLMLETHGNSCFEHTYRRKKIDPAFISG